MLQYTGQGHAENEGKASIDFAIRNLLSRVPFLALASSYFPEPESAQSNERIPAHMVGNGTEVSEEAACEHGGRVKFCRSRSNSDRSGCIVRRFREAVPGVKIEELEVRLRHCINSTAGHSRVPTSQCNHSLREGDRERYKRAKGVWLPYGLGIIDDPKLARMMNFQGTMVKRVGMRMMLATAADGVAHHHERVLS